MYRRILSTPYFRYDESKKNKKKKNEKKGRCNELRHARHSIRISCLSAMRDCAPSSNSKRFARCQRRGGEFECQEMRDETIRVLTRTKSSVIDGECVAWRMKEIDKEKKEQRKAKRF